MMTDRLKNQAQEYLRASGVSGKMIEIIAIKKRRMFFYVLAFLMRAGKMQYTLYINQRKATEWGLTPQQSILFSFLYELPSWADCHIISGTPYYYITKKKILTELPLLNSKPDTVYRWIRVLSTLGLISIIQQGAVSLVRITKKGADWNREATSLQKGTVLGYRSEGSDGDPRLLGCTSDLTSDAHPTNHYTSNHTTKPYHHTIATEPAQGGGEYEISEYLELVAKPAAQGKNDPGGYIESVRSRIAQNGFSDRDIAQLVSAKSLAIKKVPILQPCFRPTVDSESWETTKTILRATIRSSEFNLWIEPLRCIRDDVMIEIAGPDPLFCACIKKHYLEQIRKAFSGREVLLIVG